MTSPVAERPRLASYALVVRDGAILLSRLSARVVDHELWTLPGGGVEPGEDPNDAVVREVREETGLDVTVDERALVRSATRTREDGTTAHAVRLVFAGRVPRDAPAPRVLEVDGSTMDAAWHPVEAVLAGRVPVVDLVREALEAHTPARKQRLAAYGLATRTRGADVEVLLTRISPLGHHAGAWTLPGGGVDHGEPPAAAVVREVEEETGLRVGVGPVLGVHDAHFVGTAPHGGSEDFHGVQIVYAIEVERGSGHNDDGGGLATVENAVAGGDGPDRPEAPLVGTETDGTTDLAAWIRIEDVRAGRIEALDLVHRALAERGAGTGGAAAHPEAHRNVRGV